MTTFNPSVRFFQQVRVLVVGALLMAIATMVSAADLKEDAVKKDRKQIEGTWRIVAIEVNGNKLMEDDARKFSVVNGSDGTWSLLSEAKEISRGVSTIDPTQKLKTLDFTPTEGEGKGNLYLGIYELGETTRKMCFAPPGRERPTEFSSTSGNEQIFVTFEREKESAIKKDRKQIEGTWRVVALDVNGNKAMEEDAKKLTVVNGSDGTWTLFSEGNEIMKGTSTIDPTKKPRTLDFTPTEGEAKGNLFLGIYELGETTRKMCFAPSGKGRPTEFSSTPGSEMILLTFQREMAK